MTTTLTLNIEDRIAAQMMDSAKGIGISRLVERIIENYFAKSKSETKERTEARHKHDVLCGIFSKDSSLEDLRAEYLESKYGL